MTPASALRLLLGRALAAIPVLVCVAVGGFALMASAGDPATGGSSEGASTDGRPDDVADRVRELYGWGRPVFLNTRPEDAPGTVVAGIRETLDYATEVGDRAAANWRSAAAGESATADACTALIAAARGRIVSSAPESRPVRRDVGDFDPEEAANARRRTRRVESRVESLLRRALMARAYGGAMLDAARADASPFRRIAAESLAAAVGPGDRPDPGRLYSQADAAVDGRLGTLDAETLRPFREFAVSTVMPRLLDADDATFARAAGLLHEVSDVPSFSPTPRGAKPEDVVKAIAAARAEAERWWRRHAATYTPAGAWRRTVVLPFTQTRFGAWLGDLLHGDLGASLAIEPDAPVRGLIADRLPRTLLVMGLALAVLFAVGVPLGFFLGARRGGAVDRAASTALFVLHSIPEFWLGTLALVYLCSAAHVRWFPTGGLHDPAVAAAISEGRLSSWAPSALADLARHLLLPVALLSYAGVAVVARHARAAAAEALGADHVRAARARGLSRGAAFRRHVVPHALLPTAALFWSAVPALFTGSVLIERLFDIDGMGRLLWDAATSRDAPAAMGAVLVTAFAVLATQVAADVIQAYADPRTRLA